MLNNLQLEHIQTSAVNKTLSLQSQEFHLHMITYGSCIYELDHHQIVTAKRGDFILLPASRTIVLYSENKAVYECYSFQFKAYKALIEQLPMLRHGGIIKYTSGLFDRTLERLRPIWQDHLEKVAYNHIRVGSLLLDTLAIWQRELDRGELSPASIMQVERMKTYIQNHYREKITKDTLGDYIRRTPSYAATLFKKGTSQTISEYVHAVRMKTALYMLSNSLLNVTEIAEYLGYNDVSYFQRLFKRTYGRTAGEFLTTRNRV